MAKRGRKPVRPTPHQIAEARKLAQTPLSDSKIAEAVGIAHATFSYNKGKAHFQEFLAAIRSGRAVGAALVAGADFQAAISDKDAVRSQARERYFKMTGMLKDNVEISGDPEAPLNVRTRMPDVQELIREIAKARRTKKKG